METKFRRTNNLPYRISFWILINIFFFISKNYASFESIYLWFILVNVAYGLGIIITIHDSFSYISMNDDEISVSLFNKFERIYHWNYFTKAVTKTSFLVDTLYLYNKKNQLQLKMHLNRKKAIFIYNLCNNKAITETLKTYLKNHKKTTDPNDNFQL